MEVEVREVEIEVEAEVRLCGVGDAKSGGDGGDREALRGTGDPSR